MFLNTKSFLQCVGVKQWGIPAKMPVRPSQLTASPKIDRQPQTLHRKIPGQTKVHKNGWVHPPTKLTNKINKTDECALLSVRFDIVFTDHSLPLQ